MRFTRRSLVFGLLATISSLLVNAAKAQQNANPFLAPLFTNNMVLQRNAPVPVWGWTAPGSKVTVEFRGKKANAVAGPDGKWMAKLPPTKEGGPFELNISGPTSVKLTNILVGDVWICSGQSNCEMGIGNVNDADKEISGANYPNIRLFTVQKTIGLTPTNQLVKNSQMLYGEWSPCSPQTVKTGGWNGFSAIGYFFGRMLHQELNVPIGLIHTSWGGTIAEAWASEEALRPIEDFNGGIDKVKSDAAAGVGPGNNPNRPTVLYNAMISPLIPFAIKGAIWYQGESNAGRAFQYRKVLPTMITDWRNRFGVGDFPFFIVQLANFQARNDKPVDDAWAELREAQSMTAANLPKTGIAVTIDIGDAKDIHPKNKQDVGKRLAMSALEIAYKRKGEFASPTYKNMKVENSSVRLSFNHVSTGLMTTNNEAVQGFAIAGEDHKFVWADAKIDGKSVIVSSPSVKTPVAVRYGWSINPAVNLYNKAGLPTSPFRTDDWPGITVKNK
ncbi:MAG: sialate O-acetylesterase [Chthonomonadales bacterium]